MAREIDITIIKPHEKQQLILDNEKRFTVVKSGRRFGKSELAQIIAIKAGVYGKRVGVYQPTYKDLLPLWNELKFTMQDLIQRKDEQSKTIYLIGGGIIEFWSMEEPNSGRGRKYHTVIIDECEKARHFKTLWLNVIRATLADYS